jgi:hypothetical protein
MNSFQKYLWLVVFLMLNAWTLAGASYNITVSIGSTHKPVFVHSGTGSYGTQQAATGDTITWTCTPASGSASCTMYVLFERGYSPCHQKDDLGSGSSLVCKIDAGTGDNQWFYSYAYNIAIYDGSNLALADPDVIVDNSPTAPQKRTPQKSAQKGADKK